MGDRREIVYDIRHAGMYYVRSATFPWCRNKFHALRDIDFRIYAGDVIGIIGRNGAGKSTLLRLLAGIFSPDTGEVWRKYRNIGILSFGSAFEERLSGRQNIMLQGILTGVPRREILAREAEIVELAGLGNFIDQPIKVYSSGMRARLGFAIAYYLHSQVLMIDEVFIAGDDEFQRKAGRLITEKIQSGITVVMVTHDMGVVKHLCNRVIQIENGVSLPELPVDESVARYQQGIDLPRNDRDDRDELP